MRTLIFGILIACGFTAIIAYLACVRNEVVENADSWVHFSTYLSGIMAPVTAFGTLYITYLVYKLNVNNSKSEQYFSKITEIYFKIEDCRNRLQTFGDDQEQVRQTELQIKQNVTLMRYFLKRFPDISCPIDEIDSTLNHISFEPCNMDYYSTLAKDFRRFCFYANRKEERPIRIEKNNGEVTLRQ